MSTITRRIKKDPKLLIALAAEQGEAALQAIIEQTDTIDDYKRQCAAIALGYTKSPKAHEPLIKLLQDQKKDVRLAAILGLGVSEDSRATYVLINYFENAPIDIKKRTLLAFSQLKDPRTTEFLTPLLTDPLLNELAVIAYNCCKNNIQFSYQFTWNKEMQNRLAKNKTYYEIHTAQDINQIQQLLKNHREQFAYTRPQTYVICASDNIFRIGGTIEEHVAVAQGKPVLAAGEVIFEKQPDGWHVTEINNRSNGYLPDASCFHWIKKALNTSNIQLPENFTWKRPEFFHDDLRSQFPLYKYHC